MTMLCNWPGCTSVVGDDGFCENVKKWHDQRLAPPADATPEPDSAPEPVPGPGPDLEPEPEPEPAPVLPPADEVVPPTGRSQVGAGVVYIPPTPEIDPYDLVKPNPDIPKRVVCSNCSRIVRPGDGTKDDDAGECECGERYDFAPKLQEGDLVDDDHYTIVGVIGRGGQGWVYLAEDLRLKRMPCVLKGRRHSSNPDALEAEETELKALSAMDHPGIVKIFNLVKHPDHRDTIHRYIVMQCVPGRDLEHRRIDTEGHALPVVEALAYVHAVMPALGHLHQHDYVYCDLKPANLIPVGDAVIMIDLGGARERTSRRGAFSTTKGFRAPEMARTGPTVASDIYAAGRTLAVLVCGSWTSWSQDEFSLPPEDHPALRGYDCLRRLIARACARRPSDRFIDTEEMAEALHGVLSQVAAAVRRNTKPYDSRRWEPPEPQLGKLDWRSLPAPILPEQVSVQNRFSGVEGADPDATIRLAETVGNLSWADRAVLVRAHCAVKDYDTAADLARELKPSPVDTGGRRSRTTVIVETARQYLLGVVALAKATHSEAIEHLDWAYRTAPGEPACAFAYGAALEASGNAAWRVKAEDLYRQVATADPTWVAAIAGWARVLQAQERHEEAAVVYTTMVPVVHPLRHEALTLACGALPGKAYNTTVAHAAHALVPPARADDWNAREAELAAAVYRMSLRALEADPRVQLVGHPTTADELAALTATALRRQAYFTSSIARRHELLDEAAQIRPWRTWK